MEVLENCLTTLLGEAVGVREGRRRRDCGNKSSRRLDLHPAWDHVSCKGRVHLVVIDLQNISPESSMIYWKRAYGLWSLGLETKSWQAT